VKLTIACGQFAPALGDMGGNADLMRRQAAEAASRGAKIVVFPELCLSGYLPPDEVRRLAVAADGPEIQGLRRAAGMSAIAICFGFAEREPGGALHNSTGFIDSSGNLIAVYRKVHLWGGEAEWAEPGRGFEAFDSGGLRCGMWICYDTRFPEAARSLALAGANLGLVATAWLGPADEWELALRARAMDNGMFVAGAALQGAGRGCEFHGVSMIVDPHGRIVGRARDGAEEVVTAEYDEETVGRFRARLPLLRHRRPEAYA
jgi:predicted amidohydrolase